MSELIAFDGKWFLLHCLLMYAFLCTDLISGCDVVICSESVKKSFVNIFEYIVVLTHETLQEGLRHIQMTGSEAQKTK